MRSRRHLLVLVVVGLLVVAPPAAAQTAPVSEQDIAELREQLEQARAQSADALTLSGETSEAVRQMQADIDDLVASQQPAGSAPAWSTIVLAFAAGVAWAALAGWFAAWLRRRSLQQAVTVVLDDADLESFDTAHKPGPWLTSAGPPAKRD